MRIAVTGGRGRLGRALIEAAVAGGHEVISIDLPGTAAPDDERPGVALRDADATEYGALREAMVGAEALIHLAALTNPWVRPEPDVHNRNVVASYNALHAAAELRLSHACLASSVNAIGGYYSRRARYDYLPVDERHPTYNEDPYSLSKWICEAQADSFARRREYMSISTLRLHAVVADRAAGVALNLRSGGDGRDLWGYTPIATAVRAGLAALTASFTGHEVFFVVAPDTTVDIPSLQLHRAYYPDVPIVGDLSGHRSFFDCAKAERLLGLGVAGPVEHRRQPERGEQQDAERGDLGDLAGFDA